MRRAPPQDRRRRLLGLALACSWVGLDRPALGSPGTAGSYLSRPGVRDFSVETADRFGLPLDWVQSALRSGQHCEAAARWMSSSSPPPQDWTRYRQGQIDAHKLARGLSFWWKYQDALEQARAQFGTAPEIVVAIIGIESHYGRQTGRFRTLDVLLTLAFDFQRRAAEYREELAQFLMLCREQAVDAADFRGSIAGAIGMVQFLPSSIRRYALDFDQDGTIDLAHSANDSIGSVAHFLAEHGWRADLPVLLAVDSSAMATEPAVDSRSSWSQLQPLGIRSDVALADDEPLRLIGLRCVDERGRARQEPRAGTANFEALLGYNRSFFYAASVADLAQDLRRRFDADTAPSYSASG